MPSRRVLAEVSQPGNVVPNRYITCRPGSSEPGSGPTPVTITVISSSAASVRMIWSDSPPASTRVIGQRVVRPPATKASAVW